MGALSEWGRAPIIMDALSEWGRAPIIMGALSGWGRAPIILGALHYQQALIHLSKPPPSYLPATSADPPLPPHI